MTPDTEQLAALNRLDEILGEMQGLCDKYERKAAAPTPDDTKLLVQLRDEASNLYGRVADLVGPVSIVERGASRDAAQQVLANRDLMHLLRLRTYLSAFHSVVKQAVGRAEETQRRKTAIRPEAVARWAWVIRSLEAIRQVAAAGWRVLVSRPHVLDHLMQRIESSSLYRVISIVGTVGGFVSVVLLVAAGITALLVFL